MAASPGDLDVEVPASAISGSIPEALRGGRLLSNGPGWTTIGGYTAHPFDGHGYLRAFGFEADGGVRLRARFVETPSYVAEREARRIVRRGLATNVPGGPLRNLGFGERRNVANTTITSWGGQLLAGWEGGSPFALDPTSLRTIGEQDFGGAIAGQPTLAHMKSDPQTGRLLLCSLGDFMKPKLTFREVDPSGKVVSVAEVTLPGPIFAHDFAFTPNWFIVAGNPVRVRAGQMAKMLLGFGTLLHAIAPDAGQEPVLYLVPRSGGPARVVRLPEPAFVIHFSNAFERDGEVCVDLCAFATFSFGQEFGYTGPTTPFDPALPDAQGAQRLSRITIPAGADRASVRQLTSYGVDFPRVHPRFEGRDAAVMFGASRADARYSDPFDSIVRVDLGDPDRPAQLWTTGPDTFVGEPIFVPLDDHDDQGHVLVLVSDGVRGSTSLVVLDASDLGAGPLASVDLPLLPVAFHGDWDPAQGRA